jgi:hypothetical protein
MRTTKYFSKIAFAILVVAMFALTAANPFPARLSMINQTGENIYLYLRDSKGELVYYLTITGKAQPDNWLSLSMSDREQFRKDNTSDFTIERETYAAEIYACGLVMEGKMDLTRNLQLNITPCEDMLRTDAPRYKGEPSMEKPNWFLEPGMSDWRFKFIPLEVAPKDYPNTTPVAGFEIN